MIDVAQNLMSLGESIAAAHTASVNDNMTRSHYHDYYELYFLDVTQCLFLKIRVSPRGLAGN